MSNRRRTRPRILARRPGQLPDGAEVRSARITDEAGRDVSHLFGIAPGDQGPVPGPLGPVRIGKRTGR